MTSLTEELSAADRDAYVDYVAAFTRAGATRSGAAWRYADITTVLAAASELLQPTSYLEIGVRRGRSMAVVARRAPACALVGVDLWNAGYAGIDNPGEEHVRAAIAATGHTGSLELISGDSHKVIPNLFSGQPRLSFDLITVDGDHSARGARADIESVVPRLRIGGALVFDDISHPAHPSLHAVGRTRSRKTGGSRRGRLTTLGMGSQSQSAGGSPGHRALGLPGSAHRRRAGT